jgi:hypothetical protein
VGASQDRTVNRAFFVLWDAHRFALRFCGHRAMVAGGMSPQDGGSKQQRLCAVVSCPNMSAWVTLSVSLHDVQ